MSERVDEDTKVYRAAQLAKARPVDREYMRQIKVKGRDGETHWLRITDKEFEAIVTLLIH